MKWSSGFHNHDRKDQYHSKRHYQKHNNKLHTGKDVEVEIINYKEERKYVIKRIPMEICDENLKEQMEKESPHMKNINK